MLEIVLRKTMPDGLTEEKVLYAFSDTLYNTFEKEIIHFPTAVPIRIESSRYGKIRRQYQKE